MVLDRLKISLGVFVALLFIYKFIKLLRNVVQARRIGLPYVLTWTLETETIGYVLTPILRWKYQDYLLQGKGWPCWCRLMIKDWSFEDKRRAHDEYGDVFLAVSPEGIICYVCDAAMSWDVMNRRNEFTKPRDKYKLLEIYGPNVTTTEGDTFRFHLRIVAPPFADGSGANDLVWSETRLQTRRLMTSWHKKSSSSTQLDINGLTLAVIAKAGFGQELKWEGMEKVVPSGHMMSFLEAMRNTMVFMIPVLLLPRWIMYMSPLRNAATAHSEFEKYVREMIREEKRNINEQKSSESALARGNLLTSVLRASADLAISDEKPEGLTSRKQAFTENEVMGNLFLYLLAGYETTANAILYGLICLALYPDIQENLIAEIDHIYNQAAEQGRQDLTYADDFDKFKYTYGFMYETFRLFPAPQQITKMVNQPTQIKVTTPQGPQPYVLPPNCRVYLNVPATHHTPRYWPSPSKIDPTRWLNPSSPLIANTSASASRTDKKVVAADRNRHMQGTFMTFSDGARACLGRKFAQSEYVAFIVTLLREFRVKLRKEFSKEDVEKKIRWRSKGTLTLAPMDEVGLVLAMRKVSEIRKG